jgi:hypothetical protein
MSLFLRMQSGLETERQLPVVHARQCGRGLKRIV